MSDIAIASALIYREFAGDDFPGVQKLWREEAGWGELTEDMFREWYVDIPDGPAILVVAEDEAGKIAGLITMTPHRVAVDDRVVKGARIAANVVSSDHQMAKFDFASHPLVGMLLECRAAAVRRDISVLFGLPKVNWMNLLRVAERMGAAIIPHVRIGCMELALDGDLPAPGGLVAIPLRDFRIEHEVLWQKARIAQKIGCAVHRDLETLRFREGGHANFELRGLAGELLGFASVRKDGLLYDIVMIEAGKPYDMALTAIADVLKDTGMEALKVMQAPYYEDLVALGFVESQYKFGFVSDALDPAMKEAMMPANWYLAGGG